MDHIKTTPSFLVERSSPLTPLLPSVGRFSFSPSAINRILEKDSVPTVLKVAHNKRRSFTPIRPRNNASTPLVSPIVGEYKIPANSPVNFMLPLQEKSMKRLKPKLTILTNNRPGVNLMNPSGETVINLISPNVSDDSIIDLTSPPMFVSPFRTSKITSAGHNSASRSDTSIRLVDSSFDAVVKEANNSKTIFVAPLPSNAHLNDDLSVSNMLDGVNMSHLGPVFERENVLFFSVIFFIILTIVAIC